MQLTAKDVVLFQGDSITDAGRDRAVAQANQVAGLGNGYARYVAASLLADLPGVRVYNRGASGDRVDRMAARWQADCLDLRPTVISILIGINDTSHGVAGGTPENGVGLEEYDRVYRRLLTEAKAQLPGVRIVVCEPFVTEAGIVLERKFHPDLDERAGLARRIAEDFADAWVPFQRMFDDAVTRAEPAYWAYDGIHPTIAGHELMARFWLECVSKA